MYAIKGISYKELYDGLKSKIAYNGEINLSTVESEIKNNNIYVMIFINNRLVKADSKNIINLNDKISAEILLLKSKYFNYEYKNINILVLE